jgi:hypothetical protein
MEDHVSGLGILIVLFAVVAWMLFLAIRDGLKKAARLPERQREWHESLLTDGDARRATQPTVVIPIIVQPRWEREIREILERLEAKEADVSDERDW